METPGNVVPFPSNESGAARSIEHGPFAATTETTSGELNPGQQPASVGEQQQVGNMAPLLPRRSQEVLSAQSLQPEKSALIVVPGNKWYQLAERIRMEKEKAQSNGGNEVQGRQLPKAA